MTEQADTATISASSIEDMIPAGLLEPILRRPLPFVAAAFGVGLATGLVLRARGDFVADSGPSFLREAARQTGGRWTGRATAELRGLGQGVGLDGMREEIIDRFRTTLLDAAAGYFDRAVDQVADATQRAVRPEG